MIKKRLQQVVSIALLAVVLAGATGLSSGRPVHAVENSDSPLIAQATIDQTQQEQQQQPDNNRPAQNNDTNADDPDSRPNDTDGEIPTPAQTCESSFVGLGWLLCQVTRGIYGVFDFLVNEVLAERLLKIDFGDSEDSLRVVWGGFRTLANLVFILLFLGIIYAEASGHFGILETYSLTRTLPRLFFSVIGIQLSFFLVTYLVGLFNDLGDGVADIMLAPLGGFSQFDFANGNDGTWFGLPITEVGEDFIDNLIAVPVVFAIGIAAIIMLPTILTFGAFGLALLLLTLIARKIIVIALIVLAPVAFATFILPGTEKYFKMWWDTLSKALVMYPLIMTFIAAGQLLGRLAIVGDNVTFVDSMIGFIATFLPLFMIPVTFKLAGQAIGGIVGGLNTASEKLKGDERNPDSMRSRLRRNRMQRYGRLATGDMRTSNRGFVPGPVRNKAIVPKVARDAWSRLPGTNATAGLVADMAWGRDMVKELSSTIGDDLFRAATVTGGGRAKGVRVQTADGRSVWSGYAKLGKHLAYNDDGSIVTADRGGRQVAQMYDKRTGGLVDAKSGDFYDRTVMSEVYKYGNNRGFIAASAEYTMTKSNMDAMDEAQMWRGLDGTRFTKDEKSGIAQGVWYSTKDNAIHNKFGDYGNFFHDGTFDAAKEASSAHDGGVAIRAMPVKFEDMTEYVDKQMELYPLQNQKHTFWGKLNGDFERRMQQMAARPDGPVLRPGMSSAELDVVFGNPKLRQELEGIAWKARNLVNQSRDATGGRAVVGEVTDDGEPRTIASGSSSTSASARGAREFLRIYRDYIGELPGGPMPDL